MTLATDLATRAQSLGQQVVSDLSQLYDNGVFYKNNMSGFSRMPHVAGIATLYRYATNDAIKVAYLQLIKEIVAREIATTMTSGGLFVDGAPTSGPFAGFYGAGPTRASMGNTANDLDSILETGHLAWALSMLPKDSIDDSTRERWLDICKTNCDYLDKTAHDTTWYINGNFNARLCGLYWLTAANCTTSEDRARYEDCYERALRFMVDPNGEAPTKGWTPGQYGWVQSVAPTEYDWSDGQGYLTESSGFDYIYSMTQLDELSRIFVANRDTRVIRMINAISNKVYPRIDQTTWIFNGAGGSRQNGTMSMVTAWQPVQALLGIKAQNKTLLSALKVLECWDSAEGMGTKLLGNSTTGFSQWDSALAQLGVVLHAAHLAQAKVPPA